MRMTLAFGDHVWEGPKPQVGSGALLLKRQAGGLLGRLGVLSRLQSSGEAGITEVALILAGDPASLALRSQTFRGWTVDGVPVKPADIDEIEADPERGLEPWVVLLLAWMELGFFGSRAPSPKPESPEA